MNNERNIKLWIGGIDCRQNWNPKNFGFFTPNQIKKTKKKLRKKQLE
jgi:hypothetical protein